MFICDIAVFVLFVHLCHVQALNRDSESAANYVKNRIV